MAAPVATAAATLAGGAALGAYLNARFHIGSDLKLLRTARSFVDLNDFCEKRAKENKLLFYHILEDHANGANGDNLCIWFEGQTWTYKQFLRDIHRVGNWLMNDLGIQRHELVALNGTNSPEYLMLWFGLESIGACPCFINCNLTAGPLMHCVRICEPRYLLTDRLVQKLVEPCEDDLTKANVRIIWYDGESIAALSDTTPTPSTRRDGLQLTDLSSLLYTSGTTGTPKAIVFNRRRELLSGMSYGTYLKLQPGDRMYSCLPAYHATFKFVCFAASIVCGSAVVVGRKFSHKTFWPEVRASKANSINYVGELCRYLVNAPPSPQDKNHLVKMAWGNGMRPDVWEVFRQRFGIELIHELYASSDGFIATRNPNRGEISRGAIAVRGALWHLFLGKMEKRILIDVDTQDVLRKPDGFAIEAQVGEPGEAITKLNELLSKAVAVGYYRNPGAMEKRVIRDVFEKGDSWFRSGDVMRQDANGSLYFVDRLGDTFRWRSENVSTNEVGDVMGEFPQIAETNVYGVQVPNSDGRAGCAAIVPVQGLSEQDIDFRGLARHNLKNLPRYAVPIFVRVVKQLAYTGTMKLQKVKLRAEGVDPDKVEAGTNEGGSTDKMYWLPPGTDVYVPFERKDWEGIKSGSVRL